MHVHLAVGVEGRLADSVEVAAYYLVSEALTNVAKYAQRIDARAWPSRATTGT